MTPPSLRDRLKAVPEASVPVTPPVASAIAASVGYLGSAAALGSLERDPYWPKWDSPWWHMVLLFELGEACRIPETATRAMVAALDAMPVKIFPTRPSDVPEGLDVHRHTSCHCALGTMAQVLSACGVDVERALPWVHPWFVRYQMADGGLTCDNDAYAVTGECPSSMVGTIAPFEAMLEGDPARWSPDRAAFVARAGRFLVAREVRLGSSSSFNAEERTREASWRELCFPRFYFYDVLRGLRAVARWLERCEESAPIGAIEEVATHLCDAFPDGIVRAGRQSFAGVGTRAPGPEPEPEPGAWSKQDASRFPLLEVSSVTFAPSPWLTRLWSETRASLLRSIEAGRLQA